MRNLLLPVALALCPYFYFACKRFLRTLGLHLTRLWTRLVLLSAVCALVVCGMLLSWTSAVFLLHLAAFAGIVQLCNFVLKRCVRKKYEEGFSVWKRLYGLLVIPLLFSAAVTVCGYANLHSVQQTAYTVYTPKQIDANGYRVALIADVHFGVSLDEEELLEKCAEIEAQVPDLVILCGDIVDNSTTREGMQNVFAILGSIKSTYGVYYVYGNHDRLYRMGDLPFTTEELRAAIDAAGITVLQDTVEQITEDLVVVGREDRSGARGGAPRAAIADLLEGIDPADFILTLDHQPNEYAENAAAGTDLLLSGHTHGGQLFPLNILQEIVPFNDGVYGQYALGEDQLAIVTSGFGTWEIPVKTVGPAEYVIIDVLPK